MASETSFMGTIEAFPYNLYGEFITTNWKYCDGRLLKITEYPELFAIIGNHFGGDGVNNFAIPNLKDRVVVGVGKRAKLTARTLGETGGASEVTLTKSQIPSHNHSVFCSNKDADNLEIENNYPAKIKEMDEKYDDLKYYSSPSISSTTMAPGVIISSGENQPHSNIQPVLVLRYYICVNGENPF